MTLRNRPARLLPLVLACAAAAPLPAQQLIGYCNTRDADTTGASDVMDGQAVLTGSVSVTAKDHTAPILLGRGGVVHVCQTSVLHLTESKTPLSPAPLLFSLDRGAIEIKTAGTPDDSIMTPDLRFSVHNAGPLDLRLRIASNGDTCVDNRGPGAPTLAVSDPFGESMYEVTAGQHVLFEHGSLHEVVDDETSPCGCPDEKGASIADALLAPPNATIAPRTPPAPAAPSPAPVAAPQVVAVPTGAPVAAPAAAAKATPPAVKPISPAATAPVAVASAPVAAPESAAAPVAPPKIAQATAPAVVLSNQPAAAVAAPSAPAQALAAPPAISEEAVQQAAAEAAARAAALHPFPIAVSEGLAPPVEAPAPAAGAPAVPATEPLRYNAPSPPATGVSATTQTAGAAAPSLPGKKASKATASPAQPSAAPANDLVHVVGRFFKRLFTW